MFGIYKDAMVYFPDMLSKDLLQIMINRLSFPT